MINVALFGAGFVSGNHAAAYDKLPGTKLVAVLDADGERAEKLAGPRGARAYTEMPVFTGVSFKELFPPFFVNSASVAVVEDEAAGVVFAAVTDDPDEGTEGEGDLLFLSLLSYTIRLFSSIFLISIFG